jgi:hypothetical protein
MNGLTIGEVAAQAEVHNETLPVPVHWRRHTPLCAKSKLTFARQYPASCAP